MNSFDNEDRRRDDGEYIKIVLLVSLLSGLVINAAISFVKTNVRFIGGGFYVITDNSYRSLFPVIVGIISAIRLAYLAMMPILEGLRAPKPPASSPPI